MGAEQFVNFDNGKTMQEAFESCRQDAAYWHGHGGYTGTIAEKGGVRDIKMEIPKPMIEAADGNMVQAAEAFAYYLMDMAMDDTDKHYFWDDKWDDAAGFHVEGDLYCFFGWASS